MSYYPIKYKGEPIGIHTPIIKPDFNSKTVIVSDIWEYVSLWLKRRNKKKALFFWEQARSFYKASKLLPKTSSPLTSYYFILNATKTLLVSKGKLFDRIHGVKREKSKERKIFLSREFVIFKNEGVCFSLCEFLKESNKTQKYSLKNLLYNLPYIHRSFNLTYRSCPNLFIPIFNTKFVRKPRSSESWFCAELKGRYAHNNSVRMLSPKFEKDEGIKDEGIKDKVIIRRKKGFNWEYNSKSKKQNLENLTEYHESIRKHIFCISGVNRRWYVKRLDSAKTIADKIINRSCLTIIFASMHCLSELSRYDPERLDRYFDSRFNWLLSEFISRTNFQFLDMISAEITGKEFVVPFIDF